MALLGMDVDEVSRVGHDLVNNQAPALESIISAISAHVQNLPSIWTGTDSQSFVSEWEGHRQSLERARELIEHIGQTALREVEQQRQASAS